MEKSPIIDWLLQGDIAIQYQVQRDLLANASQVLQNLIAKEGWGKQFLAQQKPNLFWGQSFYQPKWISTHYTLLDLRNLCISPENEQIKATINKILATLKAADGGIQLGPSTSFHSDICVNGMFLNYAAYFKSEEHDLHSIVDQILSETMPDGGFNCRSTRSGATHSSLHSTISVLEGLATFQKANYSYRIQDIAHARKSAEEFILMHRLFLSDRTGKIIHQDFLKLPYPSRWKYDILRALDYFQYAQVNWDDRMQPAIDILLQKRNRNMTWNVQAKHPGKVHFEMEKAGKPSRWNTLRALRVLKHFDIVAD